MAIPIPANRVSSRNAQLEPIYTPCYFCIEAATSTIVFQAERPVSARPYLQRKLHICNDCLGELDSMLRRHANAAR